jgi:type I restriction enzyme S subunit
MCSTTTYPNLKVPEYISALIPLPPLAEQWQLLQVLDSSVSAITESIGASERCVELLSERRRALITATVTGQVDIRGLVKAA